MSFVKVKSESESKGKNLEVRGYKQWASWKRQAISVCASKQPGRSYLQLQETQLDAGKSNPLD